VGLTLEEQLERGIKRVDKCVKEQEQRNKKKRKKRKQGKYGKLEINYYY
jgi:hypothetical protein